MKPNAINYLSLARKAGRIEVGEEPVGAAARAGHARLVLVASDSPDNTRRRAKNFVAGTDQQMVVLPFTKEEMGIALGRTVVALAAMTDPAMALAFLNALEDPEKYGEAIARMSVKADRARRHQLEQKAHERNIRTGKVRKERELKTRQEASREKAPPAKADEAARPGADRAKGKPGPRRDDFYGAKHHEAHYGGKKPTGTKAAATKGSDTWKQHYRKDTGKPAGQKYATRNKVAGRKPGRKTHGGAEV